MRYRTECMKRHKRIYVKERKEKEKKEGEKEIRREKRENRP